MNNETKSPLVGLGGYRLGMKVPTQLCGDYVINHEIRIPSLNNQDDSWKVSESEGVFRDSCGNPPCFGMINIHWIYPPPRMLARG